MNEPKQNRGRSKQDYSTPGDFYSAVCRRFGAPSVDLAAHNHNALCERHVTPEEDSLECDWLKVIRPGELAWLNPPYGDIRPWVAKCRRAARAGREILVLVPASVGSRWFHEHVYAYAKVYALVGRLTFGGCTAPFPKDCMLLHYGDAPGFVCWDWNERFGPMG